LLAGPTSTLSTGRERTYLDRRGGSHRYHLGRDLVCLLDFFSVSNTYQLVWAGGTLHRLRSRRREHSGHPHHVGIDREPAARDSSSHPILLLSSYRQARGIYQVPRRPRRMESVRDRTRINISGRLIEPDASHIGETGRGRVILEL
jgi:hypothetical protein